jgi:hypothetical protein
MVRGALWPTVSLLLFLCHGCTKKPLPTMRLDSAFGAITIRYFDGSEAQVNAIRLCKEEPGLAYIQQDKSIGLQLNCPVPEPATSADLLHLRGAVYMLPNQSNRLYIVQGRPITSPAMQVIAQTSHKKYTDADLQRYQRFGGLPELDGIGRPIGVVVDGLEVIDKLAALPTNADKQPLQVVQTSLSTIVQQ